MRISKPFFYYLIALSLAGGGLVLLATSLYGAGVSADAAKNLSTAESLLAGISWLARWDVFISGWYLNVLLVVINVFLAGMLVYAALRERPVYAYLGVLFVLISESAVRIHANVSSDPLYITFSLAFLLAANRYLELKSAGA